jgi:hypothetical protein
MQPRTTTALTRTQTEEERTKGKIKNKIGCCTTE